MKHKKQKKKKLLIQNQRGIIQQLLGESDDEQPFFINFLSNNNETKMKIEVSFTNSHKKNYIYTLRNIRNMKKKDGKID